MLPRGLHALQQINDFMKLKLGLRDQQFYERDGRFSRLRRYIITDLLLALLKIFYSVTVFLFSWFQIVVQKLEFLRGTFCFWKQASNARGSKAIQKQLRLVEELMREVAKLRKHVLTFNLEAKKKEKL